MFNIQNNTTIVSVTIKTKKMLGIFKKKEETSYVDKLSAEEILSILKGEMTEMLSATAVERFMSFVEIYAEKKCEKVEMLSNVKLIDETLTHFFTDAFLKKKRRNIKKILRNQKVKV